MKVETYHGKNGKQIARVGVLRRARAVKPRQLRHFRNLKSTSTKLSETRFSKRKRRMKIKNDLLTVASFPIVDNLRKTEDGTRANLPYRKNVTFQFVIPRKK